MMTNYTYPEGPPYVSAASAELASQGRPGLSGPVFREVDRWGRLESKALSGRAVAEVVKRTASAAGLYAGHSLRAGFATRPPALANQIERSRSRPGTSRRPCLPSTSARAGSSTTTRARGSGSESRHGAVTARWRESVLALPLEERFPGLTRGPEDGEGVVGAVVVEAQEELRLPKPQLVLDADEAPSVLSG